MTMANERALQVESQHILKDESHSLHSDGKFLEFRSADDLAMTRPFTSVLTDSSVPSAFGLPWPSFAA